MSNEIKNYPTQGFNYRVIKGDRITFISQKAYGSDKKTALIINANPQLQGRGISLENLPFIYPGDILFVPFDSETKKEITEIKNKSADDFTFILDGVEIPITSGTLMRTMDTGADSWTVTIPWNPGKDLRFDKITAPYSYSKSNVYLGGKLQATGKMYTPTHELSEQGRIKILECYSSTADIIDSSVKPPYEKNNQTLFQLAVEFAQTKGIKVLVDNGVDLGGKFNRATADTGETEFAFLAKLASQRGLLLSCNEFSDLLITQANTSGIPVATIEEGKPQAEVYSVKYDGRQRFSLYRAISQSPKDKTIKSDSADPVVPGGRFLLFEASDITGGDASKAAAWRKNKILADALTIPFPVASWYYDTQKTKLWQPNQLVTVKSETIGAPDGFTFLIRDVKYNFDANGGRDAELSIVPPQVYTLGDIQEPWLR